MVADLDEAAMEALLIEIGEQPKQRYTIHYPQYQTQINIDGRRWRRTIYRTHVTDWEEF